MVRDALCDLFSLGSKSKRISFGAGHQNTTHPDVRLVQPTNHKAVAE